ncbi:MULTISPECIES: hypothetical protein [Caballeronia]|jgi:hypothetical protein|uniref:Uncharacterized protein n=3 Tax=Caballeronia TaxID=1827195 RepID=A0AA37MTY9_9BURK|nr:MULTISPECIES: hypothetical protein [Caballeronia]MBC8636816.1 hypothetical protein [Caballeronia sp. EK]GJH10560.1 hypothetical protein CBA19CS11_17000 [Caballeronia novacaledonica]GJH18993.1 hypothetical protein CBA19CS22_20645 [Caballeronia novacaledonica]GJH28319.1 hypothetical protein CBA19CS42_27405 [Caballeronia novacaledonica]
MRRRYEVIEKVAFALLTLSAVMDASYITWESHPNFRENVTEIVKMSADLSLANPGVGEPTPLVPMAFN